MKYPIFEIVYSKENVKTRSQRPENSDYKIEYELTDSVIKAKVTAKREIRLFDFSMSFEQKYEEDVKIFSNGYQSWSATREYSREDKTPSLNPVLKGKLLDISDLSGDHRFVEHPKRSGEFYSHTYTYVRSGEKLNFIGSLCEKTGFTVFYHDLNMNCFKIDKDVEGKTLKDGDSYELLDIVMFEGGYDEVFDKYFGKMELPKPKIDHLSGYTSWYNYFQKINEEIILRDLDALDEISESVSIFQVDDGYETYVGDWLDENPEKFPNGMKYIADKVHEKGYLAGLWLAPFNVEKDSRIYKEHPEWLVCDEKGKAVYSVLNWSGTYTLDIYNEQARQYMKTCLSTVIKDWGYDMVKLDFLYSQCILPRNGKTRGEIMDDAMKFLRECCEDKIILGCGVPLGSSFGYVDACRIGCDVDLKYGDKYFNKLHLSKEIPRTQNAIVNTIFRRHLDGRVFCNDPDVLFFRDTNLDFNDAQKVLLATINHLFGNVLFVSDNVSEYRPEFLQLIKKVFIKSDFKIISAEFVKKDVIQIVMSKNSKEKLLRFNVKTGVSNLKF